MDLKGFIKKYQIIIGLSFIVVVMTIIKLSYSNKDFNEGFIPNPTPNIEKEQIINKDYPLKGLLPYTSNNFIIEEYYSPLVLKVKILKTDRSVVEEEVKNWIQLNKLEPTSHKFIWTE